MIEFTRTSTRVSIAKACSAIVNQVRKTALVLFFLALVMTVQPHPVDAATLSSLASVGIRSQAQGAMDQATGKAEAKLSQTKGLARQAKGTVTRDIGRMESKAEAMKRSTDGAVDDGKNMLDDLGGKIQSTANEIADSVKGLGK